MGISKWLDMVLLILMLVYGVVIINVFLFICSEPIASYRIEKSAITSEEAILVDPSVKTGRDILMMLVVADDLAPFPRAVRINSTPVIRLTSEWVMNRNYNVAQIYSPSGSYKLGTMLEWQVTESRYVDDPSGSYIQYTLAP